MFTPKICYYLFGVRPLIGIVIIVLWLFFANRITVLFECKILRVLFVLLPAIFIFAQIVRNQPFFFSDDFAYLAFANSTSYLGMLQVALSRPGIWVGHHMILGFWLFKFIFGIFGTNIYPFVTVIFVLNLLSVLSFYVLSGEFIKDNIIKILTSFFFGVLYLSWISNIHELLGAVFMMLSFYSFMKWIKNNWVRYGVLSIIFYILAIFSKEITFLIFPIFIVMYLFTNKNHLKKKDLAILIPFSLTFISYTIFFASTFLGYFSLNTGYKMGFSLTSIFYNLSYYLNFLFSKIALSYLPILALSLVLYIYTIVRKNYFPTIFLLGFLILISPVLFFSNRVSSYYSYIPAIMLFIGFGNVVELVGNDFTKIKLRRINKVVVSGIISVSMVLYIFTLNAVVMNSCFLIIAPWPNNSRQQFLNLVLQINNFEKEKEKSATFPISNYIKGVLKEGGVGVLTPFLDKHNYPLYSYNYDEANSVLFVIKK
jgi:hypothetical protein